MEDRRQVVAEAHAENKPFSLQELATHSAPKFNINDFIKLDEIMPKIGIDHLLPKYNLGSYMNVGSRDIRSPTARSNVHGYHR